MSERVRTTVETQKEEESRIYLEQGVIFESFVKADIQVTKVPVVSKSVPFE